MSKGSNENSLKAAFDWKVRSNFDQGMEKELGGQVLHFKEAFHGRTGYTMSLTNTADPRKYMYYPRFDWPRISNPKITFPLDENLQQIENAELKSVTEIERAFEDRKNDIATIIIEPIQGEGGDNHFRPEFFKELRRLANEHDAMLIFDEVQTGIGMTGKMWAYSHFGVTPDMITFGKKMQTCGFLSTDRIDSVENNVFEESSRINTTWGGNLVDFVRSTKYLEIIENHQLVEKTRQNGEYMLNYLRGVADESRGLISNVRGKGLFIAFDLPSSETRDKIKTEMYKENVIVLNTGKQSIRFRPPLTITTDEIDWGMEKLMVIIKNID
ncbi:MAG: L-lysine 6-transaminase [Candidatus Heimdallarchaeota archaeon]|nr:L-lysine 6-transaminase [Candidatus Heimdallarchaeota archaeon]